MCKALIKTTSKRLHRWEESELRVNWYTHQSGLRMKFRKYLGQIVVISNEQNSLSYTHQSFFIHLWKKKENLNLCAIMIDKTTSMELLHTESQK